MNVLAYLLSPSLVVMPYANSHHITARNLLGGVFTRKNDEEMLQDFSSILFGVAKGG
jgi:hypothetical protein